MLFIALRLQSRREWLALCCNGQTIAIGFVHQRSDSLSKEALREDSC